MDIFLTHWIAIIGAVTGVSALIIQLTQYLYSKPRLRIEVTPECIRLTDKFKVVDPNNPESVEYRYATNIVLTNIGQMAAAILHVRIYSKNFTLLTLLLNKLPFRKKKQCLTLSRGNSFVEQTFKTPFILDPGHIWISFIDAEDYRKDLDKSSNVFFEVRTAHRKNPQVVRIKLRAQI
jgi:hypothetical protein